jgi:putative serine protease PepD
MTEHAYDIPQAAQPSRVRRTVAAVAAGLVFVAGGGAAGATAIYLVDHHSTSASASAGSGTPVRTVAASTNTSVTAVVAAVDPVVVSIAVTGSRESDEGSGIVLTANGLILTNNHVISAAESGGTVTVTFSDGTTANATVVASDMSEDLAIVQATGVSGRTVATFGNSDSLQVGDSVVAIGNELGLANSASAGIVSALHRKVSVAAGNNTPMAGQRSSGTTYANAVQTDAAINEGDSGGALFNLQGQVIGIDSAIATASDGSSGSVGIGFAIAINDAKAFIAANT